MKKLEKSPLRLIVVVGFFLLSGCGGVGDSDPIPHTASRDVLKALDDYYKRFGRSQTSPWAFGFCYSERHADHRKLIDAAKAACGRGRLEYRGTDSLFSDCPLSNIKRASFVCYPRLPKKDGDPAPVGLKSYRSEQNWAD